MFIPSASPRQGQADAFSSLEDAPTPRPAAPARRRRPWLRLRPLAKLLAAFAVIAAGVVAEIGTFVRVQSSDAVVSAPRIVMRTPIGGVVTQGGGAPSHPVQRGETVVRVENPLASRLPAEELQARAERLRAELAASAQRRATLATMQQDMQRRADQHAQVLAARYDAEIAGAQAAMAAMAARRDQARRDLVRRRVLAVSGDVAQAELERTQMLLDSSTEDELQQEALRGSLQTQRDAAASGLYAESGPNETSYAAQRRDEIAMRVADLDQSVAVLTAELAQTEALARATEADLARRASVELRAASDAVVWRTSAQPGDVVGPGDTVAELVVCDQVVVAAAVAQRDLAAIVAGGPATVQLAGETAERQGRVIGTLAEAAIGGDPRLATVPPSTKAASAVVLVSLGPPAEGRAQAGDCPVGRSARVVLPRSGSSLWQGLLGRLF
jgi:multidrug resistance efflux pump